MIRQVSYLAILGAAVLVWANPTPVRALTESPASCLETADVEYISPRIDANGYVTADQVTYRGGTLNGSIKSSADVFADCQHRKMIVVRNDGVQPFAESIHFDRAVTAAERYTFRDIAKIMRDNGFDARIVNIRNDSCLCENGFATKPRY